MNRPIVAALAFITCVVVVFGAGYMQWQVWEECRATNSWLFCMRVLNK